MSLVSQGVLIARISDHVNDLAPIVIVRLRNMTAIDATGLQALEDLADTLHSSGRTLILCGAREQPSRLMHQAEFHEHVGELNLDLRWAGIPSDPFGSVMITNVGSLGLDTAYVPLVPYSHVPILLALGAVKDSAVVEDGKVVAGKVMRVPK